MPKISVLMPSYNVAPYIKECIESVVSQTFTDLEILCIDAGSTDGTWEILTEYEKKDSRIRLIKSERKSYGYQMNLGLKTATGEYIGIVETDDYILPDMYQELYKTAKENEADFVKADFDVFTTVENGERIFLKYPISEGSSARYDVIFTAEDYTKSRNSIDVFIWNGIYRRTFLQENNITFQETPGAAFQDCGFRYQIALHVKRGYFIRKSCYRYRRDNAASSTYSSQTVLYNLAECKNLLSIVENRKDISKKQMQFLAREIAVIAHAPYLDLLVCNRPAQGTREALNEFRGILSGFIQKGILEPESVSPDMWLQIRMFVENPACYDDYAHLQAQIKAEYVQRFLDRIKVKKEIVLYGCGMYGSRVYCLLRRNGMHNMTAFCDGNEKNQGSICMGLPVESPEKAAEKFPEALFLFTNQRYADEMRNRLSDRGIPDEQMLTYTLNLPPMDCTSLYLSDKRAI